MNEYTFLIVFAVLTIANAAVFFFTRNERRVMQKIESSILTEIDEASDVLDNFSGKLNEFHGGIKKITDMVEKSTEL